MYFQLAWRNLWRNARRTMIILIAVIIGVWSMVLLGSLMRGIAVGMINNGISTLTGHIQIHRVGYRDDPAIENSIPDPTAVENVFNKVLPKDALWSPRVRVNAVASNARHSFGVTLVGIEPSPEAALSFVGDALSRGRYLNDAEQNGIFIGEALLEKFETKIGRKLVIMSQDRRGEIASRAYRIVGTFKAEMQATEKQFVFVPRKSSQNMLQLDDAISEIAILFPDRSEHPEILAQLKATLPSDRFEINSWRELLPFQTAYLKILDGFIWIWYLVVFIAMGFGLTNTTLMAVFERMGEFGLLKAMGMRPFRIIRHVLMESAIILTIGMLAGNIAGIASALLLKNGGIDLSALAAGAEYAGMARIIYPVLIPTDIFISNLVVWVLGLVVSLYPAFKAARFTPVQAMRKI